MKLTAIYDNGVLIPDQPVHTTRKILHLIIPDEELMSFPLPRTAPGIDERITRALPFLQTVWNLVDEKPQALEDNSLSEKELERLQAFETRSEIRRADGRPV